MHNKVVYRMAKAARDCACAVLRFNFRGVGASSGMYDAGRGEQDDLRAALRYMRERYPSVPIVAGGFSFGSVTSLRVSCVDPAVDRVIAVGTPVDVRELSFLRHCSCPKHFIHSERDEYGSRSNMEGILAIAAEPTTIAWVDAADHFFSDALDSVEARVREALGRTES